MSSSNAWKHCFTCQDYTSGRRGVLAGPLADKAVREDRSVEDVVDEYMNAAHQRHLSGTPLREGGPTRITNPAYSRMAALLRPGLFGKDENHGG